MECKIYSILLLTTILVLGTLSPIVLAYPYSTTESEVTSALNWLQNQQQTSGEIGSFAVSSWVVMAIVASEDDPSNWTNGGNSIVQYLKDNVGLLSSCSDYSRFIMSMVAAGEDLKDINGIDLVAQLESFYDEPQFGDPDLLNDDYFAVMALISAGTYQDDLKIQSAITFIKDNQDGTDGWSFDVGAAYGPDVDMTAAAIMALISAGEPQDSTCITAGLSYIKSTQDSTGGFSGGWGTSAESDSWAIQAIVAAGQDPTSIEWTENGNTPIDDLLSFQNPDGSFNDYNPAPSEWTTAYAISALLGKPYPIIRGARVNIRIEGTSSTVWKGEVFVTWSDIIDNLGTHHYYGVPNVIGALDEASEKAGFSYVVDYGWGLAYITDIDGDVPAGALGWLFRVNDHSTGQYSADQYILNEVTPPSPPHNTVLWYYGGFADIVTAISVDRTNVNSGEPFTVTITYFDESSDDWFPLEGAAVYADSTYSTDSNGQVDISISEGGSYIVYAEKGGYIRSDKVQVTVAFSSEDDSNLEVDVIPALSLEVTPESIDFGTMGPGDSSDAVELQLTNSGSFNAIVTVTVTDEDSTVFQDCIQLCEDNGGWWESWSDYEEYIEGHEGSRTNYVRMSIPTNYSPSILGSNEGTITFWLEPT